MFLKGGEGALKGGTRCPMPYALLTYRGTFTPTYGERPLLITVIISPSSATRLKHS